MTTFSDLRATVKEHRFAVFGFAVLVIIVAWVFFATYPLGFNPTDDGYVLGQAYRVLHGDVPHRDFITPRPAGSAFIHVIDFALPLPLLEASRLIATAQVLTYTALLYILISGKSIRVWGTLSYLGVVAAFLINIHTFPMMSWQTIDGILLTAAGLVLVVRHDDARPARVIGLVLLGMAPLVKQSFFLSPVLGLAAVLLDNWREETRWRSAATAGAVMAIPGLCYATLLAVTGGLDEAFAQLSSAQPVFGQNLLAPFSHGVETWFIVVVLLAIVAATVIATRSNATDGSAQEWIVFSSVAGVVALIVVRGDFRFAGYWGVELLWVVIAMTLTELAMGRIRRQSAFLATIGLMTMLSWGHPVPNLVGGSLALGVLVAFWPRDRQLVIGQRRLLFMTGCLLVLITLTIGVVHARGEHPYFDKPVEYLTFPLNSVAGGFGRIRTNEVTGEHLASLMRCIDDHPAREVAFFPDNPVLYPLLGLSNPISLDFLIPPEYSGSEARIREEVRALGARGDYLVLFQTYSGYELPNMSEIPAAEMSTRPFLYDDPGRTPYALETADELFQSLKGERITCGGLIGLYSRAGG